MTVKYCSYLFFIVLLLQLTAIAMNWQAVRFFTKPLLMIILVVWFMLASPKLLPLRYCIAAALFFSWAGDVFLLQKTNRWFMAGLTSFLLAHIMYIVFFLRVRRANLPAPPWNIYLVAGAAIYAVSLFIFLYPHTGGLKVPVGIYAAVITMMLITAAHAIPAHKQPIAAFFITGAALFVVSDSLLAINKFYHALPAGDMAVMLSYGLAQFAITKGSLLYLAAENKNPVQSRGRHAYERPGRNL